MHHSASTLAAGMLAGALVLLAGCADERSPVAPGTDGPDAPAEAAPAAPLAAFVCTADVAGGTLACAPPDASPDASPDAGAEAAAAGGGLTVQALILGGQDEFVRLTSADVCYETGCASGAPGEDIFEADVTVENLIGQALATADGTTGDASGVRIFFVSEPAVTGGTGTVAVANADGTATFTQTGQPFFQYGGDATGGAAGDELGADDLLSTEEVSAPRAWRWSVPSTVTSFSFEVYVSAAVQDADALDAIRLEPGSITGGGDHTCALDENGAAYCWGDNVSGQLGDGTTDDSDTPVAVAGGHTFTQITTGYAFSCGLTTAGDAYCWGDNASGQLGDGTTDDSDTPVAVAGGHTFTQISAGNYHACGVTTEGDAYCWGDNGFGRLGDGTTTERDVPTAVSLPAGTEVASIGAGFAFSCALTTGGDVYCWGYNQNGQLGDGTSGFDAHKELPVQVIGGHTFTRIAVGTNHTCALTAEGAAYCWGSNSGRLGDGATAQSSEPVAVVGGHTFASLAAGGSHSCGVTTGGAAYCWGSNHAGQLGIYDGGGAVDLGTFTEPTLVQGGLSFSALGLGDQHSCGIASDGSARCWGDANSGKLGSGASEDQSAPDAVVAPGITWMTN